MRQGDLRLVLRFQSTFNCFVQLLIATSGFRSVEIASSNNVQIGGREIERRGDDIEVSIGHELRGTVNIHVWVVCSDAIPTYLHFR